MTTELDWSDGDYGLTAAALEPAAEVVVDAAEISAGERVLDVACGTGNAALAAARRGAQVVGVDPAAGLLEIARERASGHDATFIAGDALALPASDEEFDVVVSVFGVIFASDAERAAAELVRVVRPDGRVAFSSWIPTGPIAAVGRSLLSALPAPPSAPARWGDPDWVTELLARHGAGAVSIQEHQLGFTAASPEAWLAEQEEHHPLWRWLRPQLSAARWSELREDGLETLTEGNEDPAAFLTTSRYLVVTALG